MTDMDKLQGNIARWQREVFPHATLQSVLIHLREELLELEDAIESGEHSQICDELADCQHLLFSVASLSGISLYTATAEKFAENRTRVWGRPDTNGVVHHHALERRREAAEERYCDTCVREASNGSHP